VGFWRRSINAAERNYSTKEWECLAVVWVSLLLRLYIEETRFTLLMDHAALKGMLHMDGAYGTLARWQLCLEELYYMVLTRPGSSHKAANTMSRISTPLGDEGSIRDAVPCLALPISSAAWPFPTQTKGGELSFLALSEFLKGQEEDGRCREIPAALDGNEEFRFRKDPNGLFSRTVALDGEAQVYMQTHMRYGVMMPEHYPPQAGHPGANRMY